MPHRLSRSVHGVVAPGYEPVADAFAEGFRSRGELGAAFAAYRDGELVVDLWGGVANRLTGAAWQRDSLQLIFSGTKGLVATCMLLLLERESIRLEDSVACHWPEFAAAGKGAVRIRDLVAHTAGLPGLARPVTVDEILDDRQMAALLAAQPQGDARARASYHPLTFGWLLGEVVRRVDGRSVGRFFAEEVAAPLGLEVWIGLPRSEEQRVTRVEPAELAPPPGPADPLWRSVMANPPVWTTSSFPFNRRDYHACELPAVNGIGTARSFARLYGCLARGGTIDGVHLLAPETIDLGRSILAARDEPLSGVHAKFGVGYRIQVAPGGDFGPVADAFGHTGAGGSVHGAWPARGVGFSYAMNRMRSDPGDDRAAALLSALAACTEATAT